MFLTRRHLHVRLLRCISRAAADHSPRLLTLTTVDGCAACSHPLSPTERLYALREGEHFGSHSLSATRLCRVRDSSAHSVQARAYQTPSGQTNDFTRHNVKRRRRKQDTKGAYRFPFTRALEHLHRAYRWHHASLTDTPDSTTAPRPHAEDTALDPEQGQRRPHEHDVTTSDHVILGSLALSDEAVSRQRWLTLSSTFSGLWEGAWRHWNDELSEQTEEQTKRPSREERPRRDSSQDHLRAPERDAVKARAEASAFLQYHCHHLYVSFKEDRKAWTASRTSQNDKMRGPVYDRTDPVSDRFSRIAATTLHASLLLHTSALYGLADERVEPLLEVCFSSSIFLSQLLNTQRHARAAQSRSRRATSGRQVHSLYGEAHTSDWRALVRAVFHYTEGVRLWELLITDTLVFPRHTQRVFDKLLQAHTGCLLEACARSHTRVDPAVRQHLAALLAGQKRQAGTQALFSWFTASDPQSAQQRSLQLLPLFWLSAATTALTHQASTVPDDDGNAVKTWCSGSASALTDVWQFTSHAVRVAFVSLLQLFSFEGAPPMEVTSWALADVLYSVSRYGPSVHTAPSTDEVVLLLSVLPASAVHESPGKERRRVFLRRWLLHHQADQAQRPLSTQRCLTPGSAALRPLLTGCPPRFRALRQAFDTVRWLPLWCVDVALSVNMTHSEDTMCSALGSHVNSAALSKRSDEDALAASLIREFIISLCLRWPTWHLAECFFRCASDGENRENDCDARRHPRPSSDYIVTTLEKLVRTTEAGVEAAAHMARLYERVQQRHAALLGVRDALEVQMSAQLTAHKKSRETSNQTALSTAVIATPSSVILTRRSELDATLRRAESLQRWLQCEEQLLQQSHGQLVYGVGQLIQFLSLEHSAYRADDHALFKTLSRRAQIHLAHMQVHLKHVHSAADSASSQ